MVLAKKHGRFEVFSRGVEEPWVIYRDGAPFKQVWTWAEVEAILRGDRRASHARARRPLAEQIAHAEAEAARHLGNYNEHREAGREKAAERSFWAAQRWLDRANELRGQGST